MEFIPGPTKFEQIFLCTAKDAVLNTALIAVLIAVYNAGIERATKLAKVFEVLRVIETNLAFSSPKRALCRESDYV